VTIDERLERAAKAGLLRDLLATGFTGFDIDAVWQEIKEGTRQELCNNVRCIIEAWQQDAPEVEVVRSYAAGILKIPDRFMTGTPNCPACGAYKLTPKLQQKGGDPCP